MRWISVGAFLAGTAVILGAFGAHALAAVLSDKSLHTFQTAVLYQFFHALGLLGLGLCSGKLPPKAINTTGWLFLLGSLLFCGSLYLLAVTQWRWVGMITPLGGLCFIVGWFHFGFQARSVK